MPTIRCREHGPLILSLDEFPGLAVVDHQGNPFPLPQGKPVVALCRCGASQRKPFCDGSHKTSGFQGADLAPSPVAGPSQ